MARTMETKTLTIPSNPLIMQQGLNVSVLVNDAKEPNRTILVKFSVSQAFVVGKELLELAEKMEKSVKEAEFNQRIAKLQAVVDDSSMPESLRINAMEQIDVWNRAGV
jgi:hypothetical protein